MEQIISKQTSIRDPPVWRIQIHEDKDNNPNPHRKNFDTKGHDDE